MCSGGCHGGGELGAPRPPKMQTEQGSPVCVLGPAGAGFCPQSQDGPDPWQVLLGKHLMTAWTAGTLPLYDSVLSFFFLLSRVAQLVGSLFPDQGSNPGPRQWKHGALTTGPPEYPLQFRAF